MSVSSSRSSDQVFLCYCSKDKKHLEVIRQELLQAGTAMGVKVWADLDIPLGAKWDTEIRARLEDSSAAVLVLSPGFFQSSYINEIELPSILERRDDRDLLTFPIVVAPSEQLHEEWFRLSERAPKVAGGLEKIRKDYGVASYEREIRRICGRIVDQISNKSPRVIPDEYAEPFSLERKESRPTETIALHAQIDHQGFGEYRVGLSLRSSVPESNWEFTHSVNGNQFERLVKQTSDSKFGELLLSTLLESKSLDTELERAKAGIAELRIYISTSEHASDLQGISWERAARSGAMLACLPNVHIIRFFPTYGAHGLPVPFLKREKQLSVVRYVAPPYGDAIEDLPGVSVERQYLENNSPFDALWAPAENQLIWERKQPSIMAMPVRTKSCDENGTTTYISSFNKSFRDFSGADEIGRRFAKIPKKPLLVILEPDNEEEQSIARHNSRLAISFVKAGAIACIYPLVYVQPERWECFIRSLFQSLHESGDIQVSLKSSLSTLPDSLASSVAILCRRKSPRIWYRSGLVKNSASGSAKSTTIGDIKEAYRIRDVIPIIGPSITEGVISTRRAVALSLALENHFPLAYKDRYDLARVMEFLDAEKGRMKARKQLQNKIRDFVLSSYFRQGEQPDSPNISNIFAQAAERAFDHIEQIPDLNAYKLLARRRFDTYVTTSYNSFFRHAFSDPVNEVVFSSRLAGEFAQNNAPTIFYLFGRLDKLRGAYVSEKDLLDFLTDFDSNQSQAIDLLRQELQDKYLLFLGFSLHQFEFRVLLRALARLPTWADRGPTQIAVQLDPEDESLIDPAAASRHFAKEHRDFLIYRGTPLDLIQELER